MRYLTALLAITAIGLVGTGCSSSNETTTARADKSDNGDPVNVGYGTQERDDISGSVATVDADQAQKERPAASVADMLQGRISGVRVTREGGGLKIRIRGRTSVYGSNDPLYVIDDVPVQPDPGGVLSFLDPRDIQSITVLKDASATAIYGSRGANGVILITTKR